MLVLAAMCCALFPSWAAVGRLPLRPPGQPFRREPTAVGPPAAMGFNTVSDRAFRRADLEASASGFCWEKPKITGLMR